MYNDIEEVISDNLSIKKAYHLSKSHGDKLQQDILFLKEQNKNLVTKNEELVQLNTQLNHKCKKLQLDIANDTSSFTSQIQQMKFLIEQKEEELANFQLRMIPSLDQDMMRVKLIAQMEGPYQQTVDKKDREIMKLKDQIHQLRRDKEILGFTLKNKQRQSKKQIEEIKFFYEAQNQRISKQIAHISEKQKGGKFEKDLIKNYKREIDELRATTDCQKKLQDQLRNQNSILRQEKSKLLEDLRNTNARRALQIHENSHEGELKALKNEKNRFEEECLRLQDSFDRMQRRMKNMQSEKNRNISELEHELKQAKNSWEKQKESLKNENLDDREEIRRLKDIKNRQQEDYLAICEKYKALQISNEATSDENRNLKIKINLAEQSLETSRYRKMDESERTIRERIEKELRVKIQKEIRHQILMQNEGRKPAGGLENQSPNKDDDDFKKTSKAEEKVKKLEQKNRRLSEKLEFANKKIIELLRDKARRQQNQNAYGHQIPGRDNYEEISPQHSYHRLLLDNRDCSLIPLVPPVIYEDLHYRGQF